MEKETKITAPNGCEIEKVEIVDGVAVVTFKEKKRKLPKNWVDFCCMFPIKEGEVYIGNGSEIKKIGRIGERLVIEDRNLLPDIETAEAVLALCQLIQLRDCYNGGWVPDWDDDDSIKYVLDFLKGCVSATEYYIASSPLYFKSEELRDEFLKYFRPLIEKLKPLYGIKKGGEE